MKLNTKIRAADGRIGTVCYHFIDGYGGVWGEHEFEMPDGGFGDELPEPEFMLKAKATDRFPGMEYVAQYEILETPENDRD